MSRAPTPSAVFFRKGLALLPRASLRLDSSHLCLPCSWGHRPVPPLLASDFISKVNNLFIFFLASWDLPELLVHPCLSSELRKSSPHLEITKKSVICSRPYCGTFCQVKEISSPSYVKSLFPHQWLNLDNFFSLSVVDHCLLLGFVSQFRHGVRLHKTKMVTAPRRRDFMGPWSCSVSVTFCATWLFDDHVTSCALLIHFC